MHELEITFIELNSIARKKSYKESELFLASRSLLIIDVGYFTLLRRTQYTQIHKHPRTLGYYALNKVFYY